MGWHVAHWIVSMLVTTALAGWCVASGHYWLAAGLALLLEVCAFAFGFNVGARARWFR